MFSQGKVVQYDAQLVHSSWAFATVLPKLVPIIAQELGETNNTNLNATALIGKKAAIDICSAHEQYCTGSNQQYNSTDECMEFIQNIPFGDIWQAGQNTGARSFLS